MKCRGKKHFAKVYLSASEKKQINMMEESEGYDEDDIFYTDIGLD